MYSLYRERGRSRTLAGLEQYEMRASPHVEVYYTEQDENVVDWVLKATEAAYLPVTEAIGHEPPVRVPVIIYPSRDELRTAFGWSNGESAMGVYWSGTVRLLSPNVWINEKTDKEKRKVFDRLNPIAHELTHYVFDYLTDGNYPRWFTEGLAQRVEYHHTGYLWLEPESTLNQPLYSLRDLEERFDQLQNQPLAYRQSFLLVDYLARVYGEESLAGLVDRLGEGIRFADAVHQITGNSMSTIYSDWHSWTINHSGELEAAG
ncbi:MAG TPA: hypothetical protein VD902_21480 [Symbiobacteriaceae bacterium]|nr:hypothetical protein [Symbiobacteriaceae bacterium]